VNTDNSLIFKEVPCNKTKHTTLMLNATNIAQVKCPPNPINTTVFANTSQSTTHRVPLVSTRCNIEERDLLAALLPRPLGLAKLLAAWCTLLRTFEFSMQAG
jgi:hypothetical protein